MHRHILHTAVTGVILCALAASRALCTEPALGLDNVESAEQLTWAEALLLRSPIADAAIQPAQMMMPSPVESYALPSTTGSNDSGWSYASPGTFGINGVPYMIGDSGLGPSVGFTGLMQIELNHPTLGVSRLSVADANSPLPVDRLYYSYRHLENASGVNFFGLSDSVDLDRHLIGWEHTFWGRSSSVELRLPLDDRLNSRFASRFAPLGSGVDPLIGAGGDSRVELGNVAAIFKFLIWEDAGLAISGGLGVELPTARDVDYAVAIEGELPFPNNPGLSGDTLAGFLTIFNNETVFLDPFLAWASRPAAGWFHQGFVQVNVAANPSRVLFQGGGETLFLQNGVPIGLYEYFTLLPVPERYSQQTLLQLNLGGGRIFIDEPRSSGFQQLAVLAELHYTTALNEAHRANLPLEVATALGTIPLPAVDVGGLRDGVDFLNAVAGLSADYAGWKVVNGVIVPLRDSPDRGFDFQVNVQIQKPY